MHDRFHEIWLVDFEFHQPDGERPLPLCLVAKEIHSGRTIRQWLDSKSGPCPYSTKPDALFIAYYASAEIGCHLALGWPVPTNVLDLCVEFKRLTSGLKIEQGRGLLGALSYFGLPGIEIVEKESLRLLAQRGPPYTPDERRALLEYCETDVVALESLLPKMILGIDRPRALLRGRYMSAAARMERTGVPVDAGYLSLLRGGWQDIQQELVQAVDCDFGVYEGLKFKTDLWLLWCEKHEIQWPRLESGSPALDQETFKDMARMYPQIQPIKELRYSLSQLRLEKLCVGKDARNRVLLSAFGSKTSRNQPSTNKFIFGPATWIRNLIRPEPDRALAYIDWEQQEFGIGAALSGDQGMKTAYQSGDPYLTFAKQAGAVPQNATKASHPRERDVFKVVSLSVQYGIGEQRLGARLALPPVFGRDLIRKHKDTYPGYWRWSDAVQDTALLRGWLETAFGWQVHAGGDPNPRSLRNFPLQATGAEMLRIACIAITERGIALCAPIHDALLIEAPEAEIEGQVALCQELMAQASEVVLGGFRLRTEAKIIRYPDRYSDPRGQVMWETICRLLTKRGGPDCPADGTGLSHP